MSGPYYPPPPQPQNQPNPLVKGLIMGAIGAAVIIFWLLPDNDTPADKPVDTSGWSRLQDSWDAQDVTVQTNLCASWIEDRDMATDLFYTMAEKNAVPDVPDRTTVQAFFDSKCN